MLIINNFLLRFNFFEFFGRRKWHFFRWVILDEYGFDLHLPQLIFQLCKLILNICEIGLELADYNIFVGKLLLQLLVDHDDLILLLDKFDLSALASLDLLDQYV